MGQKVNAVGLRIGINRDWNSKWFAGKGTYAKCLEEDIAIRRYLEAELKDAMLSHVEIGRVKAVEGYRVIVQVFGSRPGEILGQDGEKAKKFREEIKKIVGTDDVRFEVVEVKNPDLDATLVAKWIASELQNRAAFRITMKKAIVRMRKAGAKGCRTLCSGRLGGAEIAREEGYKEGVVPLTTLRADIDYAHIDAATTYGRIGVKVWICRDLNKTDKAAVNEPAPDFGDRHDRRPRGKGGKPNAATKAR